MTRSRHDAERGSVAAELALALPAVAITLLLGAGALGAAAQQVSLQDAAADAARLAARGEAPARIAAVVAAEVPGATSAITERGDLVCVTASADAGLSMTLAASSCALAGGL